MLYQHFTFFFFIRRYLMMIRAVVFVVYILSTCVNGNDWWEEDDRTMHQKDNQEFGERTAQGFLHPLFQCPDMSPSPTVPDSVEYVKAADIKVIAAFGDSLTTAIAANGSTILAVPIEYRHISWSIGGHGTYQDVITLANIVKLFNPKVLGPAPIRTVSGYPTTINDTGFNFAVTGHNTLNVSDQARHLIDTFKSYPGLNFKEDWKLLTILIGMNDICDYCKDKVLFSPDNFIYYMTKTLNMLMNEVPRMIVNVVQILPMEALREVEKPNIGCQMVKQFCSCLVLAEENSTELREILEVNREFQRRLEELLHSDRFFKKDFAVVLQPYLVNAQPPRLPDGEIDLSFFTPDCFHFTIKGHEELAKGLWNNMFQPEGEKLMLNSFSEPIQLICPSKDHPYIYTRPRYVSAGQPLSHVSLALLNLMLPFTISSLYSLTI